MRRLILAAAIFALAGCQTVSPEARVREKLIEAGLHPRMAQCMAERLVDKLSLAQLQALAQAAKVPGQDVKRMSLDELQYRLRAIGDPTIVEVVTRAGIGCAIAG